MRGKRWQPFGQQASRFNNIDQYYWFGDSILTGGVATKPGDYDPKYAQTYPGHIMLYRNDRGTDVSVSALRNLLYDENSNRFPGYQAPVSSIPSVGLDNSFMWYMGQNHPSPIQLVKWCQGGTKLLTEWAPGGTMFVSGLEYFARYAANRCMIDGYRNPTPKGVFISLLTNDLQTAFYNDAAVIAAIPSFITSIRSCLGAPTVPIYWLLPRADLYLNNQTTVTQANTNLAIANLNNCKPGGSTPIVNFNTLQWDDAALLDTVHMVAQANIDKGLVLGAIANSL